MSQKKYITRIFNNHFYRDLSPYELTKRLTITIAVLVALMFIILAVHLWEL